MMVCAPETPGLGDTALSSMSVTPMDSPSTNAPRRWASTPRTPGGGGVGRARSPRRDGAAVPRLDKAPPGLEGGRDIPTPKDRGPGRNVAALSAEGDGECRERGARALL